MNIKNKVIFFLQNWKLCIHIIIGTKHFGVNNQWWSIFPSYCFGLSWPRIVWNVATVRPLVQRYQAAKFRAKIGFLHPKTMAKLGW